MFPPIELPNACCPARNCAANPPFNRGCNLLLREHITMVYDIVGWTSVGFAIFLAATGAVLGVAYKVIGNTND